jgi:hypothetical protein
VLHVGKIGEGMTSTLTMGEGAVVQLIKLLASTIDSRYSVDVCAFSEPDIKIDED